jgi:signal transduction histidine kinase
LIPEPRDSLSILIRRLRDAVRGDVRAREEVYDLRGVIRFVAIFSMTVLAPGLLLAWYGIQGIRAEQRAGAAEVAREADVAAETAVSEVAAYFQSFQDATLNRLKSGESLAVRLPELADTLRVAFRFDADGNLAGPFAREEIPPLEDQEMLLFTRQQEAFALFQQKEYQRSAATYSQAMREAHGDRALAAALIGRAGALLALGDFAGAESSYREVLQRYGDLRDIYGFRFGDLARLKMGESELARNPVAGQADLQGLVEELIGATWVIGRGGEAAVARRALDLTAPLADPEWLGRNRIRLAERSASLYHAERLLSDMDSLGAKGRLLKLASGQFSYTRTDLALWAITWTDEDQYILGMDLRTLRARLLLFAARSTGSDADVKVEVADPNSMVGTDVLTRRSLSPWLPGWSMVVRPRYPAALAARQEEQVDRGRGIIMLSVLMIGIGALVSARLLQRELDAAAEKADFAAMVSHELRSPLTQIRVKAETLLLGVVTTEEGRSRDYAIIMRECERLSRMIDNILDFSAIRRGVKKYWIRPGDLAMTVIRAVESSQVGMEMAGVEVELELPEDLPAVHHDPEAVAQALTNLLSNAAKYGRDAGWIGVRVLLVDQEVWVEVADRGIGIAPEEQKLIFSQYYRSNDPQARRRKGTGLGLTIVDYIMKAHNGRVSVRSVLGSGTTFILHFPVRPPDATVER